MNETIIKATVQKKKEKKQKVIMVEMEQSTGAIFKSLKGSNLNWQEKIKVAESLRTSNSTFFPRKEETLLEWVCFTMVKSLAKPTIKSNCRYVD